MILKRIKNSSKYLLLNSLNSNLRHCLPSACEEKARKTNPECIEFCGKVENQQTNACKCDNADNENFE